MKTFDHSIGCEVSAIAWPSIKIFPLVSADTSIQGRAIGPRPKKEPPGRVLVARVALVSPELNSAITAARYWRYLPRPLLGRRGGRNTTRKVAT